MRVTLIHNPGAGDEEHESQALRWLVEGAGHEVLYRSVRQPGWEQTLEEPSELVAVAGGDGTVGKVFREISRKEVVVTLLPVGSANNIARTLGIGDADVDVEELVRGWENATRRRFDLGRVTASFGEVLFVESLGGGIFGDTLARARGVDVDGEEKVELGLELLLDEVNASPPLHWELQVDGVDLSGEFLAVEVMNIRELGPNFPLAPEADPGDSLLDVVQIRGEDRGALVAYFEERLRDLEPPPPALPVRRGARVELRAPAGCPLHVDDRLWPDDPDSRGDEGVVARVGLSLTLLVPRL